MIRLLRFSFISVVHSEVKDIVKLRTTRPLFQAYEHAYNLLEREYLPLFMHSHSVSHSALPLLWDLPDKLEVFFAFIITFIHIYYQYHSDVFIYTYSYTDFLTFYFKIKYTFQDCCQWCHRIANNNFFLILCHTRTSPLLLFHIIIFLLVQLNSSYSSKVH